MDQTRKPAAGPRASYILQVKREGEIPVFVLQDLRNGERREFNSWEGLKHHLEDRLGSGLR